MAFIAGELAAAAQVTDDECNSILLFIYDTYKDATLSLRYGADLEQAHTLPCKSLIVTRQILGIYYESVY